MKNYIYKNYQIYHFNELDSTNSKIREMALSNEIQENSIILSDIQTKGRGRQNRDWDSQKGNLFFSILLKPQEKLEKIQEISLISVISLQKLIKNLILEQKNDQNDEISVKNKWPNDILVNNQKISGILLESEIKNSKCEFVILGIGVNLVSNPENVIFNATNLRNFNLNIEKIEFLEKFLDIFENLYQKWQDFGFSPIKNLWLENGWRLNEEIKIKLENQEIKGIFRGLDDNGNMIIENENERKIVSFGDVS